MEHRREFIGRGGDLFLLRQVPRLLPKGQLTGVRAKVHGYDVTVAHLFGGDQVGQRLNKQALDSAFQMSGAVSCVGAFPEQVSFASVGHAQLEYAAWRGLKEPPPDGIEFEIQDLFELAIAERSEYNDLVEAVNELRGEPPPCCFHAARHDSLLQLFVVVGVRGGCKSEPGRKHCVHFHSSEVTGHKYERPGKVNALIVAQGERSLIENAQQEIPQGVAGFFNLVEENDADLRRWSVMLVQSL